MRRLQATSLYDDSRGRLVPVEVDDLGFEVRRVFMVLATDVPASRGGHITGSRQALVVARGEVDVRTRDSHGVSSVQQLVAGDGVELEPDEWIDYNLVAPDTVVLVLASERFTPRT